MQSKLQRQHSRYRPDKSDPYRELNERLTTELDKLRPRLLGKKLLDIGAGEIPFRGFYRGLDITTVDVEQNSDGSIDHVIVPGQPLPFDDSAFDAIMLFDVLEHVRNDVDFIQDCSRILRPGGVIVTSTPFMYRFHEEPHDYRRYTKSGLIWLFEEVGRLKVECCVGIGSLMFVARTLLNERDMELPLWRRAIFRVLTSLIGNLGRASEVSTLAPFSYYAVCVKR